MKKIFVTTESPLGSMCKDFVRQNLPNGFELVENPEESDIYFSCFSRKILTEEFIKGRKCFNFHLGLFPEYRGSGTYSWAIINGEKETGITLHEIDAGIDTGAVIAVGKFPITDTDTGDDILDKGSMTAYEMMRTWFNKLINGDYQAVVQTGEKHKLYTRQMWNDAHDLTKFVRAFSIKNREQAYYFNSKGEKIYLEW